ncbi:MAG TPA: hypothetical protein VGF04_10510 [Solirubrobacterales bacterium]|jgi:hypothetical protein
MADAGLFIGWGAPIHGREATGLDVFNEALAFQGKLQDAGEIESFEVALLGPHGGGLNGFILIRGSAEQMEALRRNDEFERINTRASLVVEDLGVVDALLGEGMSEALSIYRQAVDDLA